MRNKQRKGRSGTPGRGGKEDGRRTWSDREIDALKELAVHNTPTRVMGIKLGRTPGAIYAKASAIGLSLKPTNQRPYG